MEVTPDLEKRPKETEIWISGLTHSLKKWALSSETPKKSDSVLLVIFSTILALGSSVLREITPLASSQMCFL